MSLELNLTTPGLLFSIISLLMVAYNNRFHNLSMLIRQLDKEGEGRDRENILNQIFILRKRMLIIRRMQIFGLTALKLSIVSIMMIFFQSTFLANLFFIGALLFLKATLALAGSEIYISTTAIEMEVERYIDNMDIEEYDSLEDNTLNTILIK